MKKCSYCGKTYPDEATVCTSDGMQLQVPVAEQKQVQNNLLGTSAPAILITLGILALGLLSSLVSPILPWLFWVGTSVWAGVDAKRIGLSKYQVSGPAGATTAVLGCLLLWIVVFPWYLANRSKVSSGAVPLRTGPMTDGARVFIICLAVIAGGLLLLASLLYPALQRANLKSEAIQCMTKTKGLALAIHMYSADHQNQLPFGSNWCDAIQPYLGVGSATKFRCPSTKTTSERGDYALNQNLQGKSLSSIRDPMRTVLLFETDGGWNKTGGAETLVSKPRHGSGFVVGFTDGHVEVLRSASLAKLRWEP